MNTAAPVKTEYPCAVQHAMESCSDALAELAATDLSRNADPRSWPEYWVTHLQYLMGYLLVVMEETET